MQKFYESDLLTEGDPILARAILTPAVSAMTADGDASEDEYHMLGRIFAGSPFFRGLGDNALLDMASDINEDMMRRGPTIVVREAAQALTPDLRETAFLQAIRMALSDGVVVEEEEEELDFLARILEIPEDAHEKINEMLDYINRKLRVLRYGLVSDENS